MYVKLNHEPNELIRWNIALRADQLDGNFTNLANAEDRNMYNFGTIIQPKFNVIYSLSDMTDLFANVGRSFQHPFGSAAYTSVNTNARDVSINDGWEFGAQWSPSSALTARLSY